MAPASIILERSVMLRRLLDYPLSLTAKGKRLHRLHPLVQANDTFLYEAANNTTCAPHIRDAVDLKRWMLLVVVALLPCICMAIWNTGLQGFVYSSGDFRLMNEFLEASRSWEGYWNFAFTADRYLSILSFGLQTFLPIVLLSYLIGGFWEVFFACIRGHEVSEGFLVTGILYALILPPTIPYWMVAIGVSAGVILAKEVFGGSGMNIMNPALTCRAFLFFSFPGRMSGNVWVGQNPTEVRDSLIKMNQEVHSTVIDGYTQATALAKFNITPEIKRIHIDAIASNDIGSRVNSFDTIHKHFEQWKEAGGHAATLGHLTQEQLRNFVTTPLAEGGLGLSAGYYEDAYQFASFNYGFENNSDWGLFFGNKLGSMGETSVLACLLGALFLVWCGIGAWRTMVAMGLGAYLCALAFELGSTFFARDGGAWTPAVFGLPAYKHLLIGGLAFGLVFMATDPVSSPSMKGAKWLYGLFCGLVTVVIRVINPAYAEGVMLAILMGNAFAPIFDYYIARNYRQRRLRRVDARA
jgi:Na+-transporting NADH:ubiquinone oxidoreductase subunit B